LGLITSVFTPPNHC
jgi:trk system potassium uptake protein TrkA